MTKRFLTREQLLALNFPTATARLGSLVSTDGDIDEKWEFGAVGEVNLKSTCGVIVGFGWVAEGSGLTKEEALNFDIGFNREDPEPPTIEGAVLVDADGDPLEDHQLYTVLHEFAEMNDWEDAVLKRLPEGSVAA
jgi:hypothetical protein